MLVSLVMDCEGLKGGASGFRFVVFEGVVEIIFKFLFRECTSRRRFMGLAIFLLARRLTEVEGEGVLAEKGKVLSTHLAC